jgi:hypothetical protein
MQIVNKRPDSGPDSGAPVGPTASVDSSAGLTEFGGGAADEGKLHARDTAKNNTSGQYLIGKLEGIIRK